MNNIFVRLQFFLSPTGNPALSIEENHNFLSFIVEGFLKKERKENLLTLIDLITENSYVFGDATGQEELTSIEFSEKNKHLYFKINIRGKNIPEFRDGQIGDYILFGGRLNGFDPIKMAKIFSLCGKLKIDLFFNKTESHYYFFVKEDCF